MRACVICRCYCTGGFTSSTRHMASSSYTCPLCSGFHLPTYKLWLGHLRHVHNHDPTFLVTCGIDGCPTTCRNFSSLYSHVYRKHRHVIETREKGIPPGEECEAGSTEERAVDLSMSQWMEDLPESTIADIERLMGTDVEGIKRASALFILKMKEKRLLTQAAIDDIVEETTSLFDRTFTMLKAGVREKLASAGVEVDLESVFSNLSDPFQGLTTKHYQEAYFKECLKLIEPTEVKIGDPYMSDQFTGLKKRQVERYDTYHYIPILKTLEGLLLDPSIQEEIENAHMRVHGDNKLEDFCDGSVFKEHVLFTEDPKALQIVCYYDELEMANPLGAYVKKHKVGVVFFMLGNIQPKYRSRLRSVNLAIVCKAEIVEKHGINQVLQPLVQDLNKLATDGVKLSVDGTERTYKGALITFLADTLASHLVGGFKKSVGSAFRPCRTCMVTSDTLQDKFNSNEFQRRTHTNHEAHCARLSGDLHSYYSMTYGINERSILLDITHYSMLNWGLPHDVMHDCFEGVVQYEIKLLLLHCVTRRYFNVADFNHRLKDFDYGYSEVADKPTLITSQSLNSSAKHLRQGSAQSWLLARMLPLLIASSIPETDPNWQCYLKLLKIIDIVLAPLVTTDTCGILKVLIEEHHTVFKMLYPEWTIIPKMHYMVHYPEQIVALGPLIRAWTMRYEAKLHVLKCAGRVSNFKNISQTVSHRHQRWMCYELSVGGAFCSYMECGPSLGSGLLHNELSSIKDQVLKVVPQVSCDVLVHRTSWVKINGILYKPNNAYVLCDVGNRHLAEQTLVFGGIEEIVIISSTVALFIVSVVESEFFDDHFHAYAVKRSSSRLVVAHEKLLDPTVYHCRSVFGKQYINLKYYISL